ncbi:Transmembrane protein 41B [Grifola frondosa]|uniref:Transmembrane protein 41B n=1 Tax=Grifola frondosa TaxID=5627 RepID=A0A1C7M6V6_GRIFR|nr:Transmembrane protein 41B [Grifola frondosa]
MYSTSNNPYSDIQALVPDDRSAYSMATVHDLPSPTSRTSLLSAAPSDSNYGATAPTAPSTRKILWNASLKMAAIFVLSTLFLGGTLWLALPPLDDLQAFSLPGSMYLSILGGAVWGVPRALPLACACVATGATLCYLISAALGPALLTMPKWKARLEVWSTKISAHKDDIISFLIVLRIAPFPPHWVVNVVCPHVGIGIAPFWMSTFMGIFGVTVIHTTIGGSLDDMTSADDFHLISWKNFLGLSAVVVGVMIPVGLRYYFKRELESVADAEADASAAVETETLDGDRVLAEGPRVAAGKGKDTRAHRDRRRR